MRRQISNAQTTTTRGIIYFSGLAVIAIIALYFIDNSTNDFSFRNFAVKAFAMTLFITNFYYFLHARYYSVSFDSDSVYFSRFHTIGQISLDKIISVRPGIFPFSVFYKNAYTVTIEYTDKNDLNKKIKFLSKGTSEYGTIDDIQYLDTLRQLIKEKKYGR
jgi:hypothetical protein